MQDSTLGFPKVIPDQSKLYNLGYLGRGPMTNSYWFQSDGSPRKATTLSKPESGSTHVAPNIYSYQPLYTVKPWYNRDTQDAIFTTVPGAVSYNARPTAYGGQGITGEGTDAEHSVDGGYSACILNDTKCDENYTWHPEGGFFLHETGEKDDLMGRDLIASKSIEEILGDKEHKQLCYNTTGGIGTIHNPSTGFKPCRWTTEPYVVNCALAGVSNPDFDTYCPSVEKTGNETTSDPGYNWFMGDYCSKNWENDSRCATFFKPPQSTDDRMKAIEMIYNSRKSIGKADDKFWTEGLPGLCGYSADACSSIKQDHCTSFWPSYLSRNSGVAKLCGCYMNDGSYTFLKTGVSPSLPAVSDKSCYPSCFAASGDTTCTSKYCALGEREVEYINSNDSKITYPKSCQTLYFSEVNPSLGFDSDTKNALSKITNTFKDCYTLTNGSPYQIDCITGKQVNEGFHRPIGKGPIGEQESCAMNFLFAFIVVLVVIMVLCFSRK